MLFQPKSSSRVKSRAQFTPMRKLFGWNNIYSDIFKLPRFLKN